MRTVQGDAAGGAADVASHLRRQEAAFGQQRVHARLDAQHVVGHRLAVRVDGLDELGLARVVANVELEDVILHVEIKNYIDAKPYAHNPRPLHLKRILNRRYKYKLQTRMDAAASIEDFTITAAYKLFPSLPAETNTAERHQSRAVDVLLHIQPTLCATAADLQLEEGQQAAAEDGLAVEADADVVRLVACRTMASVLSRNGIP